MGRWLWLKVLVLIGSLLSVAVSGAQRGALITSVVDSNSAEELKLNYADDVVYKYNHTLATILVEYASAVYMTDLTALITWTCSRCNGLTKGFEMIELIVNVQNCLQAFVGVDHELNSIIIAFRGTQEHSIRNWIEDLYWRQLDLNYPGMEGAMVHHGFYSAYHNTTLRHEILRAIHRARELYGNIQIIITGHSMGGALASFCALDLAVNHRVKDLQLMTFGQPRIGNAIFASCFSEHVPRTIRVTHDNDAVPHLPPYYTYFPQKTYHHFPREVWVQEFQVGRAITIIEKICDDSGEDPNCSRSVRGNSISDHLRYYGVELCADTSASCKIVILNSVLQYQMDYSGNIILSVDRVAPSLVKLTTDENFNTSSV